MGRRKRNNGFGCAIALGVVVWLALSGALLGSVPPLGLLIFFAPLGLPIWFIVRWERRRRWYRAAKAQILADLEREQARLRSVDLASLDYMSGAEFEHFLAVLFGDLGYAVQHTGQVGDYGCDLVISRGTIRVAVQAKRYSQSVGQAAIREIVAAKAQYGAHAATVVTTSSFTPHAITLAQANQVALIARPGLHDLMQARWGRAPLPARILPGLPPAVSTRSPDGHWQWDGERWQPVYETNREVRLEENSEIPKTSKEPPALGEYPSPPPSMPELPAEGLRDYPPPPS